jgi:Rv0078B-related antitoxin
MSATTPEERLRIALDLADVGEKMMRTRLRREHPGYSDARLEAAMEAWMQDRPGAPFGDHPGPPSSRALGESAR